VQKPVLIQYQLQFDYTALNDVMLVVKRFGCTVQQQELQLFCRMLLGVPAATEPLFLDKVKDMPGIELTKPALP
jgi:hypothetical protein